MEIVALTDGCWVSHMGEFHRNMWHMNLLLGLLERVQADEGPDAQTLLVHDQSASWLGLRLLEFQDSAQHSGKHVAGTV